MPGHATTRPPPGPLHATATAAAPATATTSAPRCTMPAAPVLPLMPGLCGGCRASCTGRRDDARTAPRVLVVGARRPDGRSSDGPRVAPRADDDRRADLLVPDHARREPGALQHGDGAGRLPLPRLGEQVAAGREPAQRVGRHPT